MVADSLFYYHGGSYYQPSPRGYVVVSSPPGAVISALPEGCNPVLINGITYFVYGNTYYHQVPNGFEVVVDPTQYQQPTVVAGRVVVTSQALNVRTGPSPQNTIINTVHSGDILEIIGNSPGWYYIKLTNKTFGWIMAKYTTPLLQPANG